MTSGQETERVHSYNPGARTGHIHPSSPRGDAHAGDQDYNVNAGHGAHHYRTSSEPVHSLLTDANNTHSMKKALRERSKHWL